MSETIQARVVGKAIVGEDGGRGGSVEICDKVVVGDTIRISAPCNNFALHPSHGRYILLAGGIGVTPMLSMARTLEARGASYTVHFCARSPDRAAFRREIEPEAISNKIEYHYDQIEESNPLDIPALIASLRDSDHVYACGPSGFLDAIEEACKVMPPGHFHMERFKANLTPLDASDAGAFEVQLKADGPVFAVPEDKTILDVLADNGVKVPSSCLEGVCGTCIVPILQSGEVIHRDSCLYEDEQQANTAIAICVSRGAPGSRVVIDY